MAKSKRTETLTPEQITTLNTSLYFLHVNELKEICNKLSIPNFGKKLNLIIRIIHFIKTNQIINEPRIPAISLAKKGSTSQLTPDSLILKGHYKNDLKTRLFFKTIIGPHFHFTAFGIDWINQRWLDGNPPTYHEYATMWQTESQKRKEFGSQPKDEWAYINFVQKLINKNQTISRDQIIKQWDSERCKHKQIVNQIISTN